MRSLPTARRVVQILASALAFAAVAAGALSVPAYAATDGVRPRQPGRLPDGRGQARLPDVERRPRPAPPSP